MRVRIVPWSPIVNSLFLFGHTVAGLCDTCGGSGSLLEWERKWLPVKDWFRVCDGCDGRGTFHKALGPHTIHIHAFNKNMKKNYKPKKGKSHAV